METISGESTPGFIDERAVDEKKIYIPGYEKVEDFVQDGFKCFINATKSSNRLPFGKGRDIYESYPVFHRLMKNSADKVLNQLSNLLMKSGFKSNIRNRDDEEKVEMIIDINDSLLGKVGKILDRISGITKYPESELIVKSLEPVSGSWNVNFKQKKFTAAQVLNEVLEKTKHIEKPQLTFKDEIDNDRNSIFVPKIKNKYNILKPLAITEEIDEFGNIRYCHPYEFELKHFEPPETQLVFVEPKLYKDLNDTTLHFIDTVEGVKSMLNDLKKYNEIAVDLEYHSYRSFQGFTCLMQISTRDSDYIIDTLILRNDLEELNEIFTDPKIVKVLHGANLDLPWLQKDFGLYVVNLFDTFEAAKLLNYPRFSLAYLLLKFCDVTVEKHFQLADWRIRPLPEELINYARSDSHYLLYIYDNLKNLLLEKGNGKSNYLEAVITSSTSKCLKLVYRKPVWNEDGYLSLYFKSKKLFDNRQKYALKKLYEWRDHIARTHDESNGYVLPNHMLLQISEALPREAQGILACCNPIPLLVRRYLLTLHQIILKAREQAIVEPVFEESQFYRPAGENNLAPNQLACPHDLNHEPEFRDDLPVVMSNDTKINWDEDLINSKPIINIFDECDEQKRRNAPVLKKSSVLTPYQRYKFTKPFNEKKEASENDAQNLVDSDKDNIQKVDGNDVNPTQKLTTKSNPETNSERPKSLKKRKAEERKGGPSKLPKMENDNLDNLVENPDRNESKPEEEEVKLKEEKKPHAEVQPFDYFSVDFNKFQTHGNPKKKKKSEKRKRFFFKRKK